MAKTIKQKIEEHKEKFLAGAIPVNVRNVIYRNMLKQLNDKFKKEEYFLCIAMDAHYLDFKNKYKSDYDDSIMNVFPELFLFKRTNSQCKKDGLNDDFVWMQLHNSSSFNENNNIRRVALQLAIYMTQNNLKL